jgi:hypothetical protein
MTMSTTQITTLEVEIEGISKAERDILCDILNDARLSAERLAKAAAKWVSLSEESREKIAAQSNPSLRDFWARLTKVGEGLLHPQLVMIGGRAATCLGKLPLEDQERYLRERLPVVVRRGRGFDVRLVDVAEMTEDQRRQVFKVAASGAVTVRDEEAQKSYFANRAAQLLVEQERQDGMKKVERVGWRVEGGKVWVKEDKVESGITRRDLLTMLRDLGE